MTIRLPQAGGMLEEYRLRWPERLAVERGGSFRSRVAYAAAHVVIDPLATCDPTLDAAIDWQTTLEFRRYLWALGFGVAEAMDTAQRGMGLSWTAAKELIRHSCAEAKAAGGLIACGANTDQLDAHKRYSLEQIIAAYEEQCSHIEAKGGRVILMASRALAKTAKGPDDYVRVYEKLLSQAAHPVILHWLGEAFDPALGGYWGGSDAADCMRVCLQLIRQNAGKVDGIKISLLDCQREIEMRRLLPAGVRMYTGDDFHYPELIAGDEAGYSDALLGIFDGIAAPASLALAALDSGDMGTYQSLMKPTLALSRHIFREPTFFYKTGLVFLAYLNGHQQHFRMLGGQESARSILHLSELFTLADEAGALRDPALTVSRVEKVLELSGSF